MGPIPTFVTNNFGNVIMSKPKSTPIAKPSVAGEGKTLEQRNQEAIEQMVNMVVNSEEKPVDKYFRALVKLEGSDLHLSLIHI